MMMGDDESSSSSGLKKGAWTAEEDRVLVDYIEKNGHGSWRAVPKLAGHLPGRTDNEIKNLWNTHLKKKLLEMGLDPLTHRPRTHHHLHLLNILLQHYLLAAANANNNIHPPIINSNSNALSLALQHQHFNTLLQDQDQALINLDLEAHLNLIIMMIINNINSPSTSQTLHFANSHPQLNNHHHPPPSNDFTNFQPPLFIHHQQLPMPYYNNYNNYINPPPPNSSNSLPNLVHEECSPPSLKKMKTTMFNPTDDHININNINPSSAASTHSTTFEMWGDFMPHDAHQSTPAYWKHLLDLDIQ
ncbi:transcription factor MYB53-like [Senna tora]|uniref:Transcription factor MYB53-like n=1 Tax=Senna tora TaxID=362788 RepID=A0A834TVJ2_9FABA|nr:transcription factor MYB53-like [Senna tora]